MAAIPEHFAEANSLREQILYVLKVLEKGNASEIASEVIEMKGIASEEGVAGITITIEEELEKMKKEGIVAVLKEHRQKKRYTLSDNQH